MLSSGATHVPHIINKCAMRYIKSLIFVVALMLSSHAMAQSSTTPATAPRTRLVPYATATAAAERSLARQRYMQPITEWTRGAEGSYCGEFTYPFSWVERQIFMRVEGVACPYEVVLNGRSIASSSNGYVAKEYNITKLAREDKNSVELRLLPRDGVAPIECFSEDVVPTPKVYIIAQPRVRVRDVAWSVERGVGNIVNGSFSVVMSNETLGAKCARLYYELYLNDTIRLGGGYRDVELGMYGHDTLRFGMPVPQEALWSAKSPMRLSLRMNNRIEGRDVEFYNLAVGMRELQYEDGTFKINGMAIDMAWHDMSPCATVQEVADAVAAGYRALRFVAGGVAEEVLDYCDGVGVYVAVTAPINSSLSGTSRKRKGNPSNNPVWCEEYVSRITEMIHTTKRHPSVVAYFLADDSANGICLYEGYLAAKAVAGACPVFYDACAGEWNSDR